MSFLEIDRAIERLKSANENDIARCSCDLAEVIWKFADESASTKLIDYMKNDIPVVRATVAWAVADAIRPSKAVDWLKDNGLTDESARVKYWTLFAIKESGKISAGQMSQIENVLNNESVELSAFAESVIKHVQSKNVFEN